MREGELNDFIKRRRITFVKTVNGHPVFKKSKTELSLQKKPEIEVKKVNYKDAHFSANSKCRICGKSMGTSNEGINLRIKAIPRNNYFHLRNIEGQNCWKKFIQQCLELNEHN